ncbi:MAG: sigma-54 dependent transcriptional regulator [Planctomycetota bacterium]|nr:sigma-54 dependent transcriptional regulator [Planctomycetota bacterium]
MDVAADPGRALQNVDADLVVLRETVPAEVRLGLLQMRGRSADAPVVVMGSKETPQDVARFLSAGARDYIPGPLTEANLPRLVAVLEAHAEAKTRRAERFFAPECPAGVPLVGHSPAMRKMFEMIRLVAESDLSPVLILGETGTGKELVTQAVHALRGGGTEDFVAVNCATLTANLLESELFGHAKGAFTGADHEKIGLFEMAGEGTALLDEISEMSVGLQAKLLRVIQENSFRRVGGVKNVSCQATIVASSNRDLTEACKQGLFRPDLYYRLAVFPIVLPPLRSEERRADIPLLADYFIHVASKTGRGQARTLAPEAVEVLMRHDWPGNVRELRNVIERALLIEKGPTITPASLILDTQSRGQPAAAAEAAGQDLSLETAERMFIMRALHETGWQRTRAAALLGITRATLHAKLKRYRITVPETADDARSLGVPERPENRLQEIAN